MTKRTLGSVVKEARHSARMTQRELAAAVGVKASHIAYIENSRRRPSIPLINRLANALGLSPGELLVLAHPDAENMVEGRSHTTRRDDAWRRFISNKALLRRHAITRPELEVLKRVSMLNSVAHPEHFIFILNTIRLSAEH